MLFLNYSKYAMGAGEVQQEGRKERCEMRKKNVCCLFGARMPVAPRASGDDTETVSYLSCMVVRKKISKESIAGTRDRSKLRLREIVERFSKQAPKEEKLMGYNLWEPKLQEEE